MNATLPTPPATAVTTASAAARLRMLAPGERPVFLADWDRVLFVHFALDPAALQPHVPVPLDTLDGVAYVSLVAFTQKRLRPTRGGRFGELLSAPLTDHAFLNLRTYVRPTGSDGAAGRGIYFLAEWIPNRLACLVGPPLYGLPYHLARLDYAYAPTGSHVHCEVTAPDGAEIDLAAFVPPPDQACGLQSAGFDPSLDEFLLEHYTAYTHRAGLTRRFRVWHEPWQQAPVEVEARSLDLLYEFAPYLAGASLVAAHFSPGVHDVWIGPPRTIDAGSAKSPAPKRCHFLNALPPALLVAAAVMTGDVLPPWAFMWAIAFALFFACKWVTLRRATARGVPATLRRKLAYLFAWVGMDAPAFLDGRRRPEPPTPRQWLEAAANSLAGFALLWVATRVATPHAHPLATGWLGMVGLVLILHFGTFHLLALALAWRHFGFDAEPIMRAPLRAASLADFWGNRWNRGFHTLAHDLVFRPLRRTLGVRGATLAAFVASGLVHDLVISVPAGAGYGLPTLYFTLHGLAVLFERSPLGRRLKLGRGGFRARAFALALAVLPLPLLFHPPFVRDVIVPFLSALAGGVPMNAPSLATLLALGGACHLGILFASALVPRVLDWRSELTKLHPLTRHLVWTHGAFIVLTIVAFGLISLAAPADLATGTRLARLFCGFVAAFWLTRLAIQLFVFDAKPFLTKPLLKLGYHGLTVVFTYLTLVYAWAALAPRGPAGGDLP